MEITRDEFERYEDVRQSGVTNMWMVTTVSSLTGLDKEKIFEIMDRYGSLEEKYTG